MACDSNPRLLSFGYAAGTAAHYKIGLRHFGPVCRFSHGKLRKVLQLVKKHAIFRTLWLF